MKKTVGILFFLFFIMTLANAQKVVKVGAFNYYPAIFKDTDGKIKGLYVDALNDIGKKENISFVFVYGTWNEGLERIKTGEVDVLTSVALTDERLKFMDYTTLPLLTVWSEVYVNLNSEINGILDLEGKTIAVMKGDFNALYFKQLTEKLAIKCEFIETTDFENIFQLIDNKKADAGVVNNIFGAPKSHQYQLRSSGIVFNPFDIYFTVKKGANSELLQVLNNYLATWKLDKNSVYNTSFEKWSHDNVGAIEVFPSWLKETIYITLLILSGLLLFIILLRIRVRAATKKIIESATQTRSILQTAMDGFWMVDLEANIIDANEIACQMLGYTREELLKLKISDIESVETLDQTTLHIKNIIEKGEDRFESKHRHKNGKILDIEVSVKKLTDKDLFTVFIRDITDKKQAELELIQSTEKVKASEERFLLAMKASHDGLFDWDLETNAVYYSPGWKKMLGYEDHELPNNFSIWENRTDSADVRKTWELIEKLKSKQIDRFVTEFKMKHKNGTWVDIMARAEAFFNTDGKAIRIVGTHVDITDRKLAEIELIKAKEKAEENENKFALIAEYTFDWETYYDDKGNVIFINHAFEKITGFNKEDFKSKKIELENFVYKEDINGVKRIYEKIISGNTIDSYNFRIVNKNGQIVFVEICSQGIFNNSNLLIGVRTSVRDITERKIAEINLLQAKEKTEESERKFRQAFDYAGIGMVLVSLEGRFLKLNQSACQLWGYSETELLNMTFQELTYPDDLEKDLDLLNQTIEGKIDHYQMTKRYVKKDGEFVWTNLNVTLVRDSDLQPQYFVSQIEDITKQILYEQELIKAKEKAEESEKRYKLIFNSTGTSNSVFNTNGVLINQNDLSIQSLGKNGIGQSVIDLFGEKAGKTIFERMNRVIINGGPEIFDTEFDLETGKKWFRSTYQPMYDEQKNVFAVQIISQNITALKEGEIQLLKAKEKVEEINSRLNLALNASKSGTWDWNITTNTFYWDNEFLKIFDLPADTITSIDVWGKVLHPEDLEIATKRVEDAIKNHSELLNDYRIIRQNNDIRWIRSVGQTIYENDVPIRMTGICMDITSAKDAEKALFESEDKFRTLFNTLTEGVALNEIVYNEQGEMVDYRIIEVNDAFYNFGDYTNKLVIGNVATKLYGMPVEMIKYFWENHKNKVETAFTEMRSPLKDEYYYVATSPFKNNRFITSFFDITQLKKAEEALKLTRFSMDRASDGLFWMTKDARIIDCNQAACNSLGYTREELLKMSIPDIDDDFQLEAWNNIFEELRQQQKLIFETKHRHKDGRYILVEIATNYIQYGGVELSCAFVRDITQRKQAEIELMAAKEKVEESELKYRTIFEGSPIGIFRSFKSGKFIEVNQSLATMLGYQNPKEVLDNVFDISKQIYVETSKRDIVVNHSTKENIQRFENIYKRKNGEHFNANLYLREIIDEKGNPILEGMVEETTIIKRKEKELLEAKEKAEENETYLRTVMQSFDDVIISRDLNNDAVFFNRAFELVTIELFNQSAHIGLNTLKLLTNENREFWENTLNKVKNGEESSIEYNYTTTSNITKYYLTSHMPIFKGSKIVGTLEVTKDISIFKQREAELKIAKEKAEESESKLSALFSSMTEMVALHELEFDENGQSVNYRITDCNAAFTQITGIKKEDAIGKLATDVYGTEEPPYLNEFSRVAITGEPYLYTTYFAPMDKHFSISVVSPKKNQFATITNDITAMQQIQEVISAKNKELENYLYVSSHDLRSPLVNIQGFSQRLQKQLNSIDASLQSCQLEPEVKTNIDTLIQSSIPQTFGFIFSSVEKMDVLINSLLQISRIGRVKMEIKKIDTELLVKNILQQLNYQLTEIAATVTVKKLHFCYGDENTLNQLFTNILTNAIKYRKPSTQLLCTIESNVIYNKVVYSVSDNGIGINPKYLHKIWDVFYRVDPGAKESGEGIGLNIVKRIVDKHKGKIWVESEEGVGTTFYIELNTKQFEE